MSERQLVPLREYQTALVPLTHPDIRELLASAGDALEVLPTAQVGEYLLRANSKVGVVTTSQLEVRISPKIPVENVFVLLEPSKVPLELRSELIGYGADDDITTAFATFYSRLLEHTLARGMRRDYIAAEDRLVTLRGRVAIEQAMRTTTITPLPCRFDEYSIDTVHNRILKAATLKLSRLPGIGTHTRDALRHLLMWFGDVDDHYAPPKQVIRRGFNRLEQHYEPAVRLACLVLDGGSLLHTSGTTTAGTFLIDMNKVFEAFLEVRLRAALHGQLDVLGQASTYLDTDRRVRMKPDLMFERCGRTMFVADAKYKISKDISGVDSDLYQLLAYTTALGLNEGALIYAQGDREIDDSIVNVGQAGKLLHIRRIDLSGDAASIRASVDGLAQWIAGQA